MSETDRDATIVSTDDITVRKTLDVDQFQTPAVIFDVRSESAESLLVQVIDSIPASISLDDVGFHPDYGSEHWSIQDREVVFERRLEPEQEYTTIYGVRGVDDEELSVLVDDPRVEVIGGEDDELSDVSDLVSEEDGQAVRDLVSGERDSLLHEEEPVESVEIDEESPLAEDQPSPVDDLPLDDGATAEVDGSDETATPPEDDATPEPDAAPSSEGESDQIDEGDTEPDLELDPDSEPASPGPVEEDRRVDASDMPAGGVVRVLAKELRSGNVAERDRQLLRDELVNTGGSTEARIDHLQQEVADLAAYTGALEEFLDDEGSARQLLEEFRETVAEVNENVDGVLDDVSDLTHRVDEVVERVDDVSRAAEELDDDVGELDDDIDELDEEVEEMEDDLEAVEAEVTSVNDEMNDLSGTLRTVEDDLDALGEDVAEIDADVEGIDDDRAAIEDLSRRADDLDGSVASLRQDLDDMAAFRDRLSTVFGGGGVPGSVESDDSTGEISDGGDGNGGRDDREDATGSDDEAAGTSEDGDQSENGE